MEIRLLHASDLIGYQIREICRSSYGGHVGENIWGYMGTSVPLKDFSEFRVAAHGTLPKLDDIWNPCVHEGWT